MRRGGRCSSPLEGKEGYGWWFWLIKSVDTVLYLLDPSRSHTVPENHYRAESRGVLVVDRYAAYKAMSWVKDGIILLAFCWSHVRRDFIRVGKGWPKLKTWALEWLRRIRVLYRLNDSRLAAERGAAAFATADGCLRQAVAEMKTRMETELAQADLAPPCRRALESLQSALGGADAVRGRPADPDGQQHLGTTCARPCGGSEELLRLGFPMEWSTSGRVVLDLRHVVDVEAESSEMVDVVLRALRGGRGQGPGEHPTVLAVEPERREKEGVRERRTPSRGGHFIDRPASRHPNSATVRRKSQSQLEERWSASCCALNKRDGRSFTGIRA